ncbi:MAG: Rieske (2Fe-2S) protein [Actinomycetota bacterium]|nr:Rieske (2Fe-2S) protein [Actinomycetota bacterium]
MVDVSRRTALRGASLGIGVAIVSLAGCSRSPTGTSLANGAGGTSTTGAGGPVALAKLAQVPVGGSASSSSLLDGGPVVVAQPSAGAVVAFSAVCTHQGCPVSPAGKQFQCPCHGSVYDAFTGAVISGPARRPLAPIPVKVVGDSITST